MILVTYIFMGEPRFRIVDPSNVAKEIHAAQTMKTLPEYEHVHVYELEELPL